MNAHAPTIEVAPHTIVVFADLLCPFAHVAVHRLWTTRSRLGLDDTVRFDHRAFPIELFSGPGTRIGSDSEIPVLGALEPDAGWQLWNAPDWHYPNTVLLAFEAIHAAKRQSLAVSEALDRAVRRAFWAESRTIGHLNVLTDIAATVPRLDTDQLRHDLGIGVARQAVLDDHDTADSDSVSMSPHLFLPDGTNHPNPGITVHWQGDWAKGFPVIDHDDPTIYDHILHAAT
ncbi:MAG: DsbA family protein [Actinomycetota bacterium]|nr:DsbA family protein [Actinomycetota bacterium]